MNALLVDVFNMYKEVNKPNVLNQLMSRPPVLIFYCTIDPSYFWSKIYRFPAFLLKMSHIHLGRAVSPEPPLLAHTSSESRGTFRQKARSLAPLNGWACAVKIFHDGMLEDTNSLDGAHLIKVNVFFFVIIYRLKTLKNLKAA